MNTTVLAVNGTLMRGFQLNPNLTNAGATFVKEAKTQCCYRLWSIEDVHPAMLKVQTGGAKIELELWELPDRAFTTLLRQEPPGLCIGTVELENGEQVLGVLGESILIELKGKEITHYGGWRSYAASDEYTGVPMSAV